MKSRVQSPAPFISVFSRIRLWIVVAGVFAFLSMGSASVLAQSPNTYYKRGQAAEARDDFDAAYQNFQKAYSMAPKNEVFRTAYYRVRFTDASMHVTKGRNLMASGDEQGALVELLRANEIDPSNEAAQQEIARIRTRHGQQPAVDSGNPMSSRNEEEIGSIGSPAQLTPMTNDPLILHMSEDSKVVYQAIGKEAGINVLFDPDYISKRIQVDLNNVSLLDALRIVGTLSGTFWHPITQNTIFVAQNTRSKRAELDEQAVQTFYLSNAWQQNDLNDVQTALRNVMPNAKVYGVASQNAIVMRATPDELLLAQKLVNDLDKARPEVVVDIAVLEVSKNWERNLGISWPSSASVAIQPPTTSSSTTTCPTGSTNCTPTSTSNNPTLYNLAHLNSNDFAVTVGTATANALLTDNNTRILQNPRIRAADQQKASMKIGSKIPIATGSYQTGAATALVSSLVNTQFQYQDVGVNIDVTPTVHFNRDVTLKIKIEVTAQSGSVTISGVTEPILSQRVAEQTIRLREGEANILGGIQEQQIQDNWSGIPGLSQIPILRYLFGSRDKIRQDDEIVFLVVPHVVRSQDLTPANLQRVDTGPGTQSVELRHTSAAASQPSAMPPAARGTSPGALPGPSAEAAAPAALAQMRAAANANGAAADVNRAAASSSPPPDSANQAPAGKVNLMLNSPGTVISGTTFQVPVVLTGGTDVSSVPLQVQYDPSKLNLVNVGDGDLLNRDGQVVSMAHRDDGPGNLTLNVSRPPGAPGVSGAGVVCVLTFQATAKGQSDVSITRAGATTSAGKPLQAQTSQATIVVQ
ncbi:cohesin domain-containing protein [Telmatobacter sp. DSM 110680]|uniref:Cohesin domain-containing protein n=1 Tax=Telmatobacter sp. DSM 110680 TaxID=3036704 RepID=A0AAU7DK53_9BACT